MEWHQAIKELEDHVVRISTPQVSGSGWLVSRSTTSALCGIATAAHVIEHAHYWEEPIRLFHPRSGKSVVLRPRDRSVHIEPALDSAAIVFSLTDLPLLDTVPALVDKTKFIKLGVEIGWLGFPALPSADLCFFSGHVSAYLAAMSAYLIDGVAINGVSGGPAFYVRKELGKPDAVIVMGIVSAYIPNRATGEVLSGVAVVRDTTQFHDLAERFRSFDEAKSKETPPAAGPPPAEPVTGESRTRGPR
jgi:hypothetical protein